MVTPSSPRPTPVGTPTRRTSLSSASPAGIVVVGASADLARVIADPALLPVPVGAELQTVELTDQHVTEPSAFLEEVSALLRAGAGGRLIVAGPVGGPIMQRLADVALLHRAQLFAVLPTERVSGQEPMVVWEGETPLLRLAQSTDRPFAASFKRAVDVVASAVGLVVVAPVLALVAVAIRVESRGPVLFRHVRMGRDSRPFACLKLRTMRQDAEEMLKSDESLYARYRANDYKLPDDEDPRVTRFGRFLRRASLDELPQLWNVLRGEMSLVGPRPIVAEELEHFAGRESVLLSVRPGMTGAWAASGRHHIGYPARAQLELEYVHSWGLLRDLRILLGTVRAVLDPGAEPRQ